MENARKVVTYILAVILSISTIIFFIMNILSFTIMDKKYILSELDEIDYYNKAYKLIQSNFENYIQQSGLDEEVIKNIVTKEKIKEDTEQILINLYDGINEEISTNEISDKLNENIKKSLKGRILTESEETSVKQFVEKICEEYKTTILNTNHEKTINEYYSNISAYIKKCMQISTICVGISIIIIILISIRRIYRIFNAIGITLLVNGIFYVIINIYINTKVRIQTITIVSDLFSELIRKILTEIVQKIGVCGWSAVLLGIVFIIVSNLLHNIRKYGLKEKIQRD